MHLLFFFLILSTITIQGLVALAALVQEAGQAKSITCDVKEPKTP